MASGRFRTKLCRNFALGHCPQGDQCKYFHSSVYPVQTTYAMAPVAAAPMAAHAGFNPQFSFPLPAVGMPFNWAPMSPPIHTTQANGFNWGYQPMSPPPPAVVPAVQPPQFRPLSWRTTLCRHFVKNQGWCPLGDECGYIHDAALAAHASNDIRFPDGTRPPDSRAGSKHSHCWAYVQGLCRVKECPYLHPVAIHLFVPHTPCLAWPNCSRGALCTYKHPEPLIPRVAELQPPAPPPPPQHMQPPSPVQVIPSGTVRFHGTTYFPVGSPPAPPPQSIPSPHYAYYSPGMPSVAYSPYSPESIPFHSPFYETVSGLPAPASASVPRVFAAGPEMDDIHRMVGMPMSALAPFPEPVAEPPVPMGAGKGTDNASSMTTEEFPYQAPPPGPRGHARRVSVAVKSKEESDALGLQLPPRTTTRRESWMVHRQRDEPAHRSWPWAPDAVAPLGEGQSLQLML